MHLKSTKTHTVGGKKQNMKQPVAAEENMAGLQHRRQWRHRRKHEIENNVSYTGQHW